MPFARFAAGPYTATYNTDSAPGDPAGKGQGARDLGLVAGVRRWRRQLEIHPVHGDAYGSSEIDGVYRGGQCYCLMTFKEWSDAVKDALWPFGSSFGAMGQVGRLLTDLAGELVLTAVADTPAATNGPATLTFEKAILSPRENNDVVLGAEERDVPVMFRCYPYVNGQNDVVWFEET